MDSLDVNREIEEKSCGCIVFNGDRVLMVLHNKGHWDFPKGHMENSETEEETAIREVKEETNVNVFIASKHRYTIHYVAGNGNFKEVVFFVSDYAGGILQAQAEEISDIRWVSFEEALNLITFDNSRQLFQSILQERGLI